MTAVEILAKLKSLYNPRNIEGMARYGIRPRHALGISMTTLRQLAKEIGKDHDLAQELWASGIHEARILATIVDVPAEVTEEQMESWARDFDSWDVCDQCCMNLFCFTSLANQKAVEWSAREEEFTKRAAFTIMARLAVGSSKTSDEELEQFLPLIKREATDERNYVKKAVNWALRQIGKHNPYLNRKAIETAVELQTMDSKSARWNASDALRELTSPAIQNRLLKR